MQVEFERRIQLMNSNFELTEKLTSDTIFSFLNAYCERFVRNNYLQEDMVQDGTRQQKKNADALKGLITRQTLTITISQEGNTVTTTFYPTNLNFEQKGGTKYCTYTPENAFAQYTPQGNYTWLTTTMANGTMTIKATTNLKTSARTATYDIVVGSDKYTLYITQDKYIMS